MAEERVHCPICDGGTLPEEEDCEVCENRRTLPVSIVAQMGSQCDCEECNPSLYADLNIGAQGEEA